MKILSELYYGNIHPWDAPERREGEYGALCSRAARAEERFEASLTEEQRRLYLDFEEAENARQAMCTELAFIDAVRLGARLMLALVEDSL
ncbi:MAG: hypothetical protein J6C52_06975 [Clostridia bacterium]|nr:hypothetical protein [Clostridia bacterium]